MSDLFYNLTWTVGWAIIKITSDPTVVGARHTSRPGPYILACNDGDWFIIPKSCEAEFDKWVQRPTDDERSWETPSFAKRIGGCPSRVQFDSYSIAE